MLNSKKPTSVLETVALGYLFIPIVIFMLSWIKLWFAIPVVILIVIALCKVLFDKGADDGSSKIMLVMWNTVSAKPTCTSEYPSDTKSNTHAAPAIEILDTKLDI